MGVSYSEFLSPLVQGSQLDMWKPGDRCPDVVLTNGSGDSTRLYANVSYGNFVVLSLGKHVQDESVRGLVYTILAAGTTMNGHDGQSENRGGKIFTADWVGENTPDIVVVRPDMYIGYVSKDAEDDGWRTYLDKYSIRS